MVKFFLRNQKNLPKPKNHNNKYQNSKQKKQKKQKKVKDYRLVIWENLLDLIKSEHHIMIQKVIRKIKQNKQKLENIEGLEQQKKLGFEKNVEKLDKKYTAIKSIKKQHIKQITLYIILEILKIQNVDKIVSRAKLEKEKVEPAKIKQFVQNNQNIKNFIQKLSMMTAYQTELEKCAQLLDVVQEKKLHRKQKLKQRKTRKYQREHGIVEESKIQEGDKKSQNEQGDQSDSQAEQQSKQQQPQNKKTSQLASNKPQQPQTTLQPNHKKQNNFFKNNQKPKSTPTQPSSIRYQNNKNPKFQSKPQSKFKPIHKQPKQRTQFKKTGRNKVKYEKQKKKQKFRQQGKNNKFNNNNNKNEQNHKGNRENNGVKIVGGRPNYPVEQAHPSWQAKQDLKKEVYIKPFQGKKILL